MNIAVLSDIHGNLPALLAVLDDVRAQRVDHVINLGDALSGPLYPRETADLLMSVDWLQIRGNHERQVLGEGITTRGPSDRFTHDALDQHHLDWLRALPATAWWGDSVWLCHGSPRSDLEHLLEDFPEGRFGPRPHADVQRRLSGIDARVVLCGHSHVPRAIVLPSGQLVVNPGSVGLQAYEDEHPVPHQVQIGDPRARYAVLRSDGAGWQADLRAVAYDHTAVHDLALSRGRPDWAHALLTGRMPTHPTREPA